MQSIARLLGDGAEMDILAVHGVGSPPVGSILSDVAARAEICDPPVYKREDLLSEGQSFPSAVNDAHGTRITEVNWGDLRRPMRTPVGIIRHLLLLMSAMLTVPVALCPDRGWGKRMLGLYRAAFETLIFWAVLLPVITMLITTSPTRTITAVLTAAGAAFVCILAYVFGKFSPWYKAGFIWSIAVLTAGTIAIQHPDATSDVLILVSARICVSAQVLLAVLLSACALHLLFRRRELKLEQKLGHLALLYFPFAILSGLGALLWSAALYPSKQLDHAFKQQRFEAWGKVFLKGLHYDLRPVEWVFTLAIGLAGALTLGIALRYLWGARTEAKGGGTRDVDLRVKTEPGFVAQNGVEFLLYAMPILLSVASCYFLFDLLGYNNASLSAWASRFGFQHNAGASGTDLTAGSTQGLDCISASPVRISTGTETCECAMSHAPLTFFKQSVTRTVKFAFFPSFMVTTTWLI